MNTQTEWVIDDSNWSKYWKHRNLNIISHAPSNLFEKAPRGRAFSDWNRQIEAGKQCIYYINGKKISDYRAQTDTQADGKLITSYKPFQSEEEFEGFLAKHLFSNYGQEEQKKMVAMVLEFGYQSGLLHATSSAVSQMVAERSQGTKALQQPNMRVDLFVEDKGLIIKENNEYKTWREGTKTHTCTENKPYYVKTETTYILQPNKVILSDLLVDCPSRNLAKILDERPSSQQMTRFPILRQWVADVVQYLFNKTPLSEKEPEEKILHQPKD